MQVISFLNQKGGVGKTTISTNVAHALQCNGKKVLLADADPQGSARNWHAANCGEILPVIGMDRKTIATDIQSVSNGYDFVVVDGAPQLMELVTASVKVSDLIIIPVHPSPYDIWATSDLVDIVKSRQAVSDFKAVFLISKRIKNTKLSNEIAEILEEFGLPVMTSCTSQRVLYPSRAAEGGTVLTGASNPAASEIIEITNEILRLL